MFFRNEEPIEVNELIDPSATPQQRLELSRCYLALDSLPANQRLAWVLRVIQGESLADVAERCECSLATAKRHIQITQRHLRKVAFCG
jgi:RNA polymerase sigma-70 factor (ECF subfamily)